MGWKVKHLLLFIRIFPFSERIRCVHSHCPRLGSKDRRAQGRLRRKPKGGRYLGCLYGASHPFLLEEVSTTNIRYTKLTGVRNRIRISVFDHETSLLSGVDRIIRVFRPHPVCDTLVFVYSFRLTFLGLGEVSFHLREFIDTL